MVNQVKRSTRDPYRTARFREIARRILRKDREFRKHGLSVDTAGAIANALERAYKEGALNGTNNAPPAAGEPGTPAVDWVLIAPRPRGVFWMVCLWTFGSDGRREEPTRLVPAMTPHWTQGWAMSSEGWSRADVYGPTTVAYLVRLGLLAPDQDAPGCLKVSELGAETWRHFIARGGKYPDDLPGL